MILIISFHLSTNKIILIISLSVSEPLEAAATGIALARIELMASAETRRAVQTCRGDQYIPCDPYHKYRMSDGSW